MKLKVSTLAAALLATMVMQASSLAAPSATTAVDVNLAVASDFDMARSDVGWASGSLAAFREGVTTTIDLGYCLGAVDCRTFHAVSENFTLEERVLSDGSTAIRLIAQVPDFGDIDIWIAPGDPAAGWPPTTGPKSCTLEFQTYVLLSEDIRCGGAWIRKSPDGQFGGWSTPHSQTMSVGTNASLVWAFRSI